MPELWDILDESGNKTGRLCERGTTMHKGEYHLVIQVWIKNSKNEFLISRRTNNGDGGVDYGKQQAALPLRVTIVLKLH